MANGNVSTPTKPMDMNSFMEAIMNMWPDWAASQGLEPPNSVSQGSEFPADAQGIPPAASTAQLPAPQAGASAVAPQAPASTVMPTPNPVPEDPTMAVDAAMLLQGTQPGMEPTTNQQLFPTDMLQIPQADIEAAPKIEAPASPMQTAMGAALSGIKTPQAPQYTLPSPPNLPALKDINPTLLAVLQAAGLTAPQTSTGLSLGQRIR